MKKFYTLLVFVCLGVFSLQSLSAQNSFDMLNLVGDAVPAGFYPGNPTPMYQSEDNAAIFIWKGYLKAGEFKISTFVGDWCDGQWINPAAADQSITVGDFIVTTGCDGPDNKWRVTEEEAGNYTLTVNLETSMLTVETHAGGYSALYLVGDAAPAGWDIASPTPMTVLENNPNVFTWSGALKAGEMKISTFTGDWCDGDWLNAVVPDQSITETSLITTNCDVGPDNKWLVLDTEAGNYVITVDVLNEKIFFEASSGGIYNGLFLVGDAAPAGWSIQDATPMIMDEENPNLFTWSGTLTAGELKFSAFQSADWCGGDWLLATVADQVLTATDYKVYSGCAPGEEDFKWKVTTESEYSIVIDLEAETIAFTDLTTSQQNISGNAALRVYPNPAVDQVYFDLAGEDSADVQIYNVAGQLLFNTRISGDNNAINVAEYGRNNLLVIQVTTPTRVQVVKVIVK